MSPTSMSDGDGDLPFTIGVTDATPHACHFCDKAFQRHHHLKQHEQREHDQEPIFECQYCRNLFKHKRSRDRHLKLHTGDFKYRCMKEKCGAKFSRSDHLNIHMRTHQNGKPYPCVICGRGYSTAASLTSHMSSHKKESAGKRRPPPDKPFKCLVCQAHFATSEELQEHGLTHKDGKAAAKSIECTFCFENFSSIEELKNHVGVNHIADSQGRCSLCLESFTDLEDLLRHKKVHEEEKKRKRPSTNHYCMHCPRVYPTSIGLRRHLLNKHPRTNPRSSSISPLSTTPEATSPSSSTAPSRGELYCVHCNTPFADPVALAEHKWRMHAKDEISRSKRVSKHDPSLKCNLCHVEFPDFEKFNQHFMWHLESRYECYMCGERAAGEQEYVAHVAAHCLTPAQEFRCEACPRPFSDPQSLQRHMQKVHSRLVFRCRICSGLFDDTVSLELHFADAHTKPSSIFRCNMCGEVCHDNVSFKNHVVKMHLSNNTAVKCPLCNQCFASESDYRVHFLVHTPFPCRFCKEHFYVEFLRDRHMQEMHSSELSISEPSVAQDLSLKISPSNVTYKCDHCDATFAVESALSAHRSQAHNVRTSSSQKQGQTTLSLDCAYCHEPFKSRTELANHTKSHCVSSSKHKCNICDEMFPSAATLAEHKMSHMKVENYRSCVVCNQSLRDEGEFLHHFHQHNVDNIPAPCVICRQTLKMKEELNVHARNHLRIQGACRLCRNMFTHGTPEGQFSLCKDCFYSHEQESWCSECQVKFENPEELSFHKTTYHRKPFQCIMCQLNFKSESEVRNHVLFHLIENGSYHKCHLCQTVLDTPAKLQCHLIEHSFEGESNYCCYLCGAVFTGPHLILKHMLQHHQEDKPYYCESCPLSFFFKKEIENHRLDHLANYRCPYCSQTFPSQKNLLLHSKVHDDSIYSKHCEILRYPPSMDLKLDIRTHSKRKRVYSDEAHPAPHQKKHLSCKCEQCGERFTSKDLVKEHMRLHITSTTHSCETCPETFESQARLKDHMAAAHEKKFEHACSDCKEVFESSEALEAHVRKDHPLDVESESMSGQSTSSGDTKDGDSSECSSNLEESDTRDSQLPVAETRAVSQAVS